MKKAFSLMLAVVMMFGGFSVASSAKSTYNATWKLTAKVGSTNYDSDDIINVAPGDTVYVTLAMSNDYYIGPTCAQIFYSTSIFTGASAGSFNKNGKLYSVCSASGCASTDWTIASEQAKGQGWPIYSATKLAEFKNTHHFTRVTMTPNLLITTTAVKSINENLVTIPYNVSKTAAVGTTGEIVLPIESMRTSSNKTGFFYCSIYKTSEMTGYPDMMYSDSQSFDCTKAILKFKVSNDAVTVNPDTVSMNYKGTAALTATVNKGTVKTVNWSSSDTSVATVDKDGKVTATGKGTATITAKTTDGKYSGQSEVTVKYSFWQYIIIYVLFGFIWYK